MKTPRDSGSRLRKLCGEEPLRKVDRLVRHSFGGTTAILNPYNLRWQYLTGDYVGLFDFFDEPRDLDEISRHLDEIAGGTRTRRKLVRQIEGWANDGYIVPAGFDESSLIGWCRRFGSRSARLPSILYIFPTLSCNLRCRYCFIVGKDGERPSEGLSLDKLERAVDLVIYNLRKPIRKGTRTSFTFLFYGGEPLLRRDFFFEAVRLIESRRREFGSVRPRIGIITNGTMIDDEVASFIKSHRIDAGISLDGDRGTTNKARIYPDGRGAFADIMRGARTLRRHGVPFGLSVTVGKHNVDLLPAQIRWLAREFGRVPIGLNAVNLSHCRGRNPLKADSKMTEARLSKVYDAIFECGMREDQVGRRMRSLAENRPYLEDCAAEAFQMVLLPDGKLGPCHAYASSRKNFFGGILGRRLDISRHPLWRKLSFRTPLYIKRCYQSCEYFTLCGGGCFYEAERVTGSMWSINPQACVVAKVRVHKALEWLYRNQTGKRPRRVARNGRHGHQ